MRDETTRVLRGVDLADARRLVVEALAMRVSELDGLTVEEWGAWLSEVRERSALLVALGAPWEVPLEGAALARGERRTLRRVAREQAEEFSDRAEDDARHGGRGSRRYSALVGRAGRVLAATGKGGGR